MLRNKPYYIQQSLPQLVPTVPSTCTTNISCSWKIAWQQLVLTLVNWTYYNWFLIYPPPPRYKLVINQVWFKNNFISLEWLGKIFNFLQIYECCQDGRGCAYHCSGSEAGENVGFCHCRPHQQGHREAHSTRKTHQTPWKQLISLPPCLTVYCITELQGQIM